MYNSDLIEALFVTVTENLRGINKIGIAFSGGIDSTLLAMICKNMNIDTTLLTVGFPDSKSAILLLNFSNKNNIKRIRQVVNYLCQMPG